MYRRFQFINTSNRTIHTYSDMIHRNPRLWYCPTSPFKMIPRAPQTHSCSLYSAHPRQPQQQQNMRHSHFSGDRQRLHKAVKWGINSCHRPLSGTPLYCAKWRAVSGLRHCTGQRTKPDNAPHPPSMHTGHSAFPRSRTNTEASSR
jgi:hypothetical protein